MAAKLKIEKRGDEILIVHCCFSVSQKLNIASVVSEEKIFFKFHPPFSILHNRSKSAKVQSSCVNVPRFDPWSMDQILEISALQARPWRQFRLVVWGINIFNTYRFVFLSGQ
jgi:hypothetical protein